MKLWPRKDINAAKLRHRPCAYALEDEIIAVERPIRIESFARIRLLSL